ncbi:MAG: TldD/PmbA family protein [Lachnospiraceae bacterium]|nr:TldD/PmbA family protein [Lachnospiraceae bacterium]
MRDLKILADRFENIIKKHDLAKYTYTLTESEKQEFNIEHGDFKLLRTVYSSSGSIKVFLGDRMGSANGTDVTDEGLESLVNDATAAAMSSPEDPAHDFAPDQGRHSRAQGVTEPDLDRFIERIKEFLNTVAKEYPRVRILNLGASHDKWTWFSRNTNGTEFCEEAGAYSFMIEISAAEGDATTGFDYTSITAKDLDTPFIELGDIRRCVENIDASIYPEPIEGEFMGSLVITPGCAADFTEMLIGNYASSGVVIDGTSLWLDKVGEQVVSDKLTVSVKCDDDRIVLKDLATADGFLAENATIIDKGVLKQHLLSLYAANKTGRPVVKSNGGNYVVEPGDKSLDELIAGVEKGLLLGRFSGGNPGTNGDFSGVAKNSFLIENGRIKCAVAETMVNGNLGEMFKNIRGISRELVCNGSVVMPYISVDGINISGK